MTFHLILAKLDRSKLRPLDKLQSVSDKAADQSLDVRLGRREGPRQPLSYRRSSIGGGPHAWASKRMTVVCAIMRGGRR